jgi:putative MATE family efflux protein
MVAEQESNQRQSRLRPALRSLGLAKRDRAAQREPKAAAEPGGAGASAHAERGAATAGQESKQPPSLFSLAFPSILANLLYSGVAIVQMRFIGELGPQALAAIGVGQRVFFALQAVLMAVSAGTTALVARAWGAGDQDEAARITMASLAAGGVFALAVTVPGILFAAPVASIFGLDPHTIDLAASNIRWMSVFNLAFAVNFILGAALRAAGDAWSPLWIGGAVNVVNVPLLYLFVFGHYGFPEMGVAGAAVAGGISFTIGGAVMLGIWLAQGFRVKYIASRWFRRERFRRLLHVGYPAGMEVVVFQVGYFAFLMLIGHYYGTIAFAAYNVGSSLLMVCFVVGFGFSIAGATLAGQHLGAKDPDAAVRSTWRSAIYAVASMGSIGMRKRVLKSSASARSIIASAGGRPRSAAISARLRSRPSVPRMTNTQFQSGGFTVVP